MTRRTQAERSAATREALVQAALELLVERGWAGVTSVAVCARAELTRGAFVHHFDGLPQLFSAALDHRYAALAEAAAARPAPASVADLITAGWESMTTIDFKVVIEAWLAAANDRALAAEIGPVIEGFAKLVEPERRSDLLADEDAQSFFLMARETMLGLALGRATNGAPLAHEARVLEHLLALAHDHDARLGREGDHTMTITIPVRSRRHSAPATPCARSATSAVRSEPPNRRTASSSAIQRPRFARPGEEHLLQGHRRSPRPQPRRSPARAAEARGRTR